MSHVLRIFFFMLFGIRTEDLLYESMTYHIFLIELDMSDAFDVLQNTFGSRLSASLVSWQIYLCHITCDDCFCIGADTCQEHF